MYSSTPFGTGPFSFYSGLVLGFGYLSSSFEKISFQEFPLPQYLFLIFNLKEFKLIFFFFFLDLLEVLFSVDHPLKKLFLLFSIISFLSFF